MLFNEDGGQFGVVSGGCLESDLFHQARKCWMTGNSRTVTYDMQDEGDVAWRLGIGCGGEVTLLLQPVTADNHYLQLPAVLDALKQQQAVEYHHWLGSPEARCQLGPVDDSQSWYSHTLNPRKSLLILGGGVDAIPLAELADRIGWQVTVSDPRARYARAADFSCARTHDLPLSELAAHGVLEQADAIIVMHHQIGLDGEALTAISQYRPARLGYLALLGPDHRTSRVFNEAGLTTNDLPLPLQSPAGFDIGGDLPESIALSMLAQAHAALFDKPYRINSHSWQSVSA